METVSVSPKFQIVIPRRIREALGLKPGQKMQAILYGDRVELIPLRPLAAARGILKGITADGEQNPDRA
ncbi:MAG: AbrB/MazE/SpoVT family DNA-binding domain-containing protein [Geminicoccaceae bacterium]